MGWLKNRLNEFKENAKEKKRFQKLVNQETLPIRRAAYLEQKKRQATEEGKNIAKKEMIKQKEQEVKKEEFGLQSSMFEPTSMFENSTTKRRKKTNGN